MSFNQLNEFLSLFNKLYAKNEELREDTEFLFEAVNNEVNAEKVIEKIALEIRKLGHEADAIKSFVDELKSRKERKEKAIEALRNTLQSFLEQVGVQKVDTPLATVSLRFNQPKVIVLDEKGLPDILCNFTRKPNLVAIKEALQSGEPIAGAQLSNGGQSVTVRIK